MASGILSLLIPLVRLEGLSTQKVTQQVYATVNWNGILEQTSLVAAPDAGLNWATALVYIYFAGITFFLLKLIFNLLAVRKLITQIKSGSAFSFFNKKVVDADLPLVQVIDIHEDAHIRQWHSLDILFFELIAIITWINPIVYLYKKSIKNIHEFLADEKAAAFQGDKAEYAMLILSQSFGIAPNRLTNGFFNKSLIKKRIMMLQKERSKKVAIMKYGIFFPLLAILVIFSSATIRKNQELLAITDQIPLDKPIEILNEIASNQNHQADAKLVDNTSKILQPVNVAGNWKKFYQYLARTIKYPDKALKNDQQGIAQLKFTVHNNEITTVHNVEPRTLFNVEVKEAILSFNRFGKLKDGQYLFSTNFKINNLDSDMPPPPPPTMPTNFKNLPGITILANSPLNSHHEAKIYDFISIEKQPEFPGGITKFYEYLGKSIRYPKLALENNVQGKVFLSFIVEKDGSLSDVQITRGLGSGTDEEAIRVIKESPKWNPGIADGKTVRVKYNINVNFKLNDVPENGIKNLTHQLNGTSKQRFTGLVIMNGKDLGPGYDLSTIDGRDIESISILKDANATSLYGSRAKNGVILVITKGKLFRPLDELELQLNQNLPAIKLRERF